MVRKGRVDYCIECRKDTNYKLNKECVKKYIRDKEYNFTITVARCVECNEEMGIPEIIDLNIKEIDDQYRDVENIVRIKDIENLMEIYKIGKAPLSLVLGFGEITITRYLAGQVPSKEYSDVIKNALISPEFMIQKLDENKGKLAEAAYNKAINAAYAMKDLISVSEKMLQVISIIFNNLNEVTHLMLQKLLYFIQGVNYAIYGESMFQETCEAWIHGPVYPKVYDMFRDFKYNPIDDARFVIFDRGTSCLTNEERKSIDLVMNTFGMYGGKVLEYIAHSETPWKEARKGIDDSIRSNEPISNESIREYYVEINRKYSLETETGLKNYINSILEKI